VSWYGRTGATLPFADPAREHGVAMEGTFWRFTEAARVTIVLHGRCLAPDGAWSLVCVAAHPGGFVDWAIGDHITSEAGRLRVRLPRAQLDAAWSVDQPWPRAFGGLGPAQVVPGLAQYWHPHLLAGAATGTVTLDGAATPLTGTVYGERNWGSRFPGHWWWGQAHVDAATVAFAGGRTLGQAPTAVVIAVGGRVIRLAPPLARVVTATAPGRWRVRAGTVELEAEADPAAAHVLPVPVPAERRVVMRSRQHLAGRLALTVHRRGGVVFRGETELAGLERGVPA
jgi:tocopherol cyclase